MTVAGFVNNRIQSEECILYAIRHHHSSIQAKRIKRRMANTYNSTVGGAKESVGRAIGSEHLAGSGANQKAQAQAAQNAREAETHAQGLGHNVKGSVEKTVGGATNDPNMEARGHEHAALGDAQRNI
ncbi:hypothetical protein BGZ76_003014 [Entomortierella beljakovae]|nr:hypothetical protein BGZ76_003014 [Entomortierella beljakovae]